MIQENKLSFDDFKGIRVKLFEEFVIEEYTPLNESENQYDILKDLPQELREKIAKRKVLKALQWLSSNKKFFAKLLLKVNVFGSSDPRYTTMCTNGFSIQYHPQFVLNQSEAAIRFVLCHEILHCAGNHMARMEKRNPTLWNIACDYSINQILDAEVSGEEKNFNWPRNCESSGQVTDGVEWYKYLEKSPEEISLAPIKSYPYWSGSIMGICGKGTPGSMDWPEKFRGKNAETIYKLLEENEDLKQMAQAEAKRAYGGEEGEEGIHVVPSTQSLSSPDSSESVVRSMGQDSEGEEEKQSSPSPGGEGQGEKSTQGGEGSGEKKPGEEGSETGKEPGSRSTNIVGKRVRVTSGPNAGKIGIVRQVLPDGDIIIDEV